MELWYKDGLSFECVRCGRCCGGSPGVVWVDPEEICRIADFLAIQADDLWGGILRRLGPRVSLVERSNGDCIFLKRTQDGGQTCSIYAVRPQQCRTWPFWNSNLDSRRAWDRAAANCPGFNRGPHYDVGRIEAARSRPPWYQQPDGEPHDTDQ